MNLELEKTLSPIWKLVGTFLTEMITFCNVISSFKILEMYFSGLFFDWCWGIPVIMEGPNGLFLAVWRIISIGLSLIINILALIISLGEMVVAVQTMQSVQRIVIVLLSCSTVPLHLVTHLNFLTRRKELVAFFRDWKKQLEGLNSVSSTTKTNKLLIKSIYGIYIFFGLNVITVASIFPFVSLGVKTSGFWNVPLDSDFESYWKFIQWAVSALSAVFLAVADIIPSLVYYHLAQAIQNLIDGSKSVNLLTTTKDPSGNKAAADKLRRISSLYDSISNLVTRADHLFGSVVITNHGITFVVICALISSSMSSITKQPEIASFFLFSASVFIFRLVWCVMVMSQVHFATGRLKAAVLSGYQKQNSQEILGRDCGERRCWKVLLYQLQADHLAACPSGLYKITPGILLNMFGLVATYTIILLQSK